jgi:eukaryotic-like serine/threonine-protein kinase
VGWQKSERFFQKKEIHPLPTYLQGGFICSKCQKPVPLQGFAPLEMGRCPFCGGPNFIPQKISKFWLFYPLGGGGMGAVYKAYHEDAPDNFYAVKVLPREKKEDPELIQNLQSEAAIVTDLGQHPCIICGIESGYRDGEHYLASQFVEGERLDKRIERMGTLPDIEVLLISLRLLPALAHIYNSGYLFRDLKPENVLITEDSGAFLYDYGICMRVEKALDDSGEFVEGSPFYMPPERLSGGGERAYSEIYSLGMLLYNALAGKTYFSASELKQLAQQLMRSVRLSNLDSKMKKVTPDIARIIDKMIKREPERRYQTFIEAERDVIEVLNQRF